MKAKEAMTAQTKQAKSAGSTQNDEQAIRQAALRHNVPCVTTMTGAEALIEAIATKKSQKKVSVRSLQEIHSNKELSAVER